MLVSGLAKSGKSMTAYKIGRSERINAVWVLDLGEGSADEYGELGCYEVLDWGRSFVDLQDTVRWCIAQPCPADKMNVVVLDSGTDLWDSLKARADKRARNSKRNVEALKNDPDYEVDVSMPYWNDAKETWARVISPMKLAGHLVGVVIVRSEIVAEVINGAPTKNRVTSYQCEKTLQGAATAHVSVQMDHTARLIEARSMHVSVTPQGLALDPENPLGDLIDRLSPTGAFAAPSIASPVDDQRDNPDRIDAEQAKALIALLAPVDDTDVKSAMKQRFTDTFGPVVQLTRENYDTALAWMTDVVARYVDGRPSSDDGWGEAPVSGPYAEDAEAAADLPDVEDRAEAGVPSPQAAAEQGAGDAPGSPPDGELLDSPAPVPGPYAADAEAAAEPDHVAMQRRVDEQAETAKAKRKEAASS